MSGRFITLEGPEGGGKTTQLPSLTAYLQQNGIDVVQTREPGGTVLGERLRAILLDKTESAMCADSELLLMFAARAEHIEAVIKPALAAGQWVISDRFTDASYAYQGGGRGISNQRIGVLETWVQGDFQPDMTILLDVPEAVSLERASKRGEKDRFEDEALEFYTNVRRQYLMRAQAHNDRFRVVNGCLPVDEVERQIQQAVAKLL